MKLLQISNDCIQIFQDRKEFVCFDSERAAAESYPMSPKRVRLVDLFPPGTLKASLHVGGSFEEGIVPG